MIFDLPKSPYRALARRLGSLFVSATLVAGCSSAHKPPPPPPALLTVARPPVPTVVVPTGLEPQSPLDGYVAGVPNFGFVSAELWRGARPTPEGFRTLVAMGVRTVVDLQEEDESASIPAGVEYVPQRVSMWRADRVDIAAVLDVIARSPKPVFIHCLEGRDRTGLAVAAYRLAQGMPAPEVLNEMNRFHVNFWWRSPMEKRIRELERDRAAAAPWPD